MIDNGLYVDKPRKLNSSLSSFTLFNNATVLVVPASAKRKRLTFFNQGIGVLTVHQTPVFDIARFIPISNDGGPIVLDVDDYGSMVQSAWYGEASTTSSNLGVIDTQEE